MDGWVEGWMDGWLITPVIRAHTEIRWVWVHSHFPVPAPARGVPSSSLGDEPVDPITVPVPCHSLRGRRPS